MNNINTLDLIITIVTLVSGILLLTGHGDVFMKGGNIEARKKHYDVNKMTKGCGIAIILMSIFSAVHIFITDPVYDIVNIVAVLVIIAGYAYFVKVKCKK